MSANICSKDTLLYPANILLFTLVAFGYFCVVMSLFSLCFSSPHLEE